MSNYIQIESEISLEFGLLFTNKVHTLIWTVFILKLAIQQKWIIYILSFCYLIQGSTNTPLIFNSRRTIPTKWKDINNLMREVANRVFFIFCMYVK